MLKFEIRNIIVDEKILGEVQLEFVNNIGVDTFLIMLSFK
jgi:hypothetical protein